MNKSDVNKIGPECINLIEAPAGKHHFLLNENGKYFLKNDRHFAQPFYLVDAVNNSFEVAKNLALRKIIKDMR